MLLPDYWLSQPAVPLDHATQAAFDQLWAATLARGSNQLIDYKLAAPKWQFLCYVASQQAIVLHGSGDPDIALFEPRQALDLDPFGAQKAIYAASDGVWAMFFAIVDRKRYPMSLNNACFRLADPTGQVSGPFYLFSISQTALVHQPWRTGSVYLLPRATFEEQAPIRLDASEVRVAQLASLVPVTPLARLEVTPADFPFLAEIRGHDDARLHEYALAMRTGGPWPD